MASLAPKGAPIFILGIAHRSGTNFLSDLLGLHPDCGRPAPVWEDFLAHHLDLLTEYVEAVCRHWRGWGDTREAEQKLSHALGEALIAFLDSRHEQKRTVTKTPSVRNLGRFFSVFPNAHLIILVRDGRAVVESALRSFGGSFEARVRHWAEAARTILRFDDEMRGKEFRYIIVRYEDIWRDLEGELRRIFGFLALDAAVYDFEAAAKAPVRGSSVLGRKDGTVHWDPVHRTAQFDPLRRWADWPRARHKRFNWIAGRYLRAFGYGERTFGTNRLGWTLWNLVQDVRWVLLRSLAVLGLRLLRRLPPDSPVRRKVPALWRRFGAGMG